MCLTISYLIKTCKMKKLRQSIYFPNTNKLSALGMIIKFRIAITIIVQQAI